MKRGRAARGLALLTLALAPISAAPQAPDAGFVMRWVVAPDPPRTGPFLVGKQEEIQGGAIYPTGLATLSEPIAAVDPGLSLPEGTMLVMAEGDVGIGCTLVPQPRFSVRFMSNETYGYHRCFVDRDADGRFDAGFTVAAATRYSSVQGGRIPAAPVPITGGAFVRADPQTLSNPPRVSIRFFQRDWGGQYQFSATAGDSGPPNRAVKVSEFGREISYAGIVFRILRKAEQGELEVELVQGLEPRGIRFGY